MVENIVGKGEMLVTSNFSSPTIFFKRLFPRERDNSSLYEKGLSNLASYGLRTDKLQHNIPRSV